MDFYGVGNGKALTEGDLQGFPRVESCRSWCTDSISPEDCASRRNMFSIPKGRHPPRISEIRGDTGRLWEGLGVSTPIEDEKRLKTIRVD